MNCGDLLSGQIESSGHKLMKRAWLPATIMVNGSFLHFIQINAHPKKLSKYPQEYINAKQHFADWLSSTQFSVRGRLEGKNRIDQL